MTEQCEICGLRVGDGDEAYCCVCGKLLCEHCLRTPEDADVEVQDFCVEDYAAEGLADLWRVAYWDIFGDGYSVTLDVPPGTHSFKISGLAREGVPLWGKLRSIKKIGG